MISGSRTTPQSSLSSTREKEAAVTTLHQVETWWCQGCGYEHGPFPVTTNVDPCPRCHVVNWSTKRPAFGQDNHELDKLPGLIPLA